MYSVFKFAIPVALAVAVASCGSDDTAKRSAEAELATADSLISQGNYALALESLDSIEARYPQMIEVRRRAHDLRPKAIEQYTVAQIQQADSLIAVTQEGIASLEGEFNHVDGGSLEGYYLPKCFKAQAFTNAMGFQPRVNDADFRFYIVANNTGKKLGVNRLAYVISGNRYVSETIPSGSERSSSLEGSELVTFLPEEVDSIGRISFESQSPVSEVVLIGTNGSKSLKVSSQQADGLKKAWRYGNLKNQLRSALILREKLDRQLQTARDQLANRVEPEVQP